MKNKTHELLVLFVAAIISIGAGYVMRPKDSASLRKDFIQTIDTQDNTIQQAVIETLDEPVEITKIYEKNRLIGIINDENKLNALMDEVYAKDYKESFPNTKLGYSQDVYITKTSSYNLYEDKDTEIFNYINTSNLLSIEVEKVSFSNGAIIYIKDKNDFINAREKFILSYISKDTYDRLMNNEHIDTITDFGSKEVGFTVLETITMTRGLASIDEIMLSETEILNFLSFGYTPDIKSYTVQEYDTIDGIAWLNEISTNQLVSINKDTISDSSQILKPGTDLKIAKFNSPLTVQVTEQRMVEEKIYPEDTIYREDPSLREGLTRVEQVESVGYQEVVYEDVYQNDTAISSTQVSTKILKEPVRGIIYVGTYVEPKVGSGDFRWPMNNARLTCGWYCYAGHQGADFQSRSNRGYGPIYASDRGVVVTNTYHYQYGYYVIIDHNNGFQTVYAHMEGPGYFQVGTTVKKGEQIGYVGMTGTTSGPHVHFEVRLNGVRKNPCTYLGC